jgi:hypothetical protein
LYGRAGRLTAQNGGFRPGQLRTAEHLGLMNWAAYEHGPGPPGVVTRAPRFPQ